MSTNIAYLPDGLRQTVEDELDDGERIMWLEQPRAMLMARRALPILLFGIPWTAFSVFWMGGAWKAGAPLPFVLFGTPFVLVGIVMLSSPIWMARQGARTAYVVTDRRAIVFSGGFSTSITSYGPGELGTRRKKRHADGSGDILFRQGHPVDADGDRRMQNSDAGFIAVPDLREADRFLDALFARHAKPGQQAG